MIGLAAVLLLTIRSILSVGVNEPGITTQNYNDQLLKSTLSTCTYSIGLGETFNLGWGDTYVTVHSGQSSAKFTRLEDEINPKWFDFQVQTGDLVSVDFTLGSDGMVPYYSFYSRKCCLFLHASHIYISDPSESSMTISSMKHL